MADTATYLHRRSLETYCGRLTVLETGRTQAYDPFDFSTVTQLWFPAMPDSVELARSAEYIVNPSPVMPDGFHQYKWTNPLPIPFAFKLFAMDEEYCPRGSLSLLEIAALLHSFTLPLSGTGKSSALEVQVGSVRPKPEAGPPSGPAGTAWGQPPKTGAPTQVEAKGSQDAQAQSSDVADNNVNTRLTPGSTYYPPVTLRLELIYTDENTPGIVATGYMKDAKVKFNGPWLRGPKNSFNLPTSGDFEFTFMHVPGYGNNFNLAEKGAKSTLSAFAYAHDVRQRLYNTDKTSLTASRTYRDFSSPMP